PGAAVSALDYANLLVQTPLGILSNMILVPFLPVFSRLSDPNDWAELKMRIRQGLLLTAIAMLPMSALIVALATPIVRVVYERGEFQLGDSNLVATVLIAYAIGMFVYLGRDVLVRVFYALGDGETPFRISIVNIFLNALFDFILIKPLGLPGLVLATVSVNVISMIALLWFLDRKLNGLPLREWALPFVGLAIGSGLAGFASWGTLLASQKFLGTNGLLILIGQLSLSGLVGLGVFALVASRLKLPEVDIFVGRIRQRFVK
ncbi:MAG: polysaccharide biosynthesis C-terminal domain-containing protein, partial [Phormidesmis sp. CAN_BIN44]|nr:polysaccharide biosynthesis C-terminal domain-containing protein [Phormidesmis sp. CAN_BIN44]